MLESFELRLGGFLNGEPHQLVRRFGEDVLVDVAYEQGAVALVLFAAVLPIAVLRRSDHGSVDRLPVYVRTRLDLLGECGRDFGSAIVVGELREDDGLVVATVQAATFALELGEQVQVASPRLTLHAEGGSIAGHALAEVSGNRGLGYQADAMVRLWGAAPLLGVLDE